MSDHRATVLAVDPEGRCAVISLCSSRILVWALAPCAGAPAATEISTEKPNRCNLSNRYSILSSSSSKMFCSILSSHDAESANAFVLDLAEYGVKRIKKMEFLEGFLEPSLMILFDTSDSWSG